MIISAKGYSRMIYHEKWHREAEKRGLRNPWSYSPKKPLHTEEIISLIRGVEIPATKVIYGEATDEEIKLWEKERDEWIRQRDEWVALQMFAAYGYETFLEECESYGLTKEFSKSILPCESVDSQCNFFCPIYKDCAIRLN